MNERAKNSADELDCPRSDVTDEHVLMLLTGVT